MIGTHSVVLTPDISSKPYGAVLNTNPYFTTDLADWTNMPFTDPWQWSAGQAIQAPGGNGWLIRAAAAAPIMRAGVSTFRLRIRLTVKANTFVYFGLFYGDSAANAAQGPGFGNDAHAKSVESVQQCASPGTYVLEMTHSPTPDNVPAAFTYVAPQVHFFSLVAGVDPAIDSVEVQAISGATVDLTCLVDEVSIHHGRDDTTSQPEASSCTLDLSLDAELAAFPDALDVGGQIRVTTDSGTTHSTRFVGIITDVAIGWDEAGEDTPYRVVAQVIATGSLADLGRRVVGDAPWPQQLDGARVAAILAAAGVTLDAATSDPGAVQILARDVDSQPALDLAQEVATDAGGLLWTTRSQEVRYADAYHRKNAQAFLEVDACDILVTPTWQRTSDGLINQVSIGYGPEPADGSDQTRYTAQNDASITRWGTWELSATTQLAAQADAEAMGQLLLARNSSPVWVMGTLPVDVGGLSSDDTNALLAMEIHSLLSLTGLPIVGSAPTSAYLWVEGWSETLRYAEHELELVVSGYCRTTPPPQWDDVQPATTWDTVGTLTWDDASCLGPTPNLGRWSDVPASTRWNTVPPATTWDTWK